LEWIVIIILIAIVLAAECFNCAIEASIDLFINHYDERARFAKDVAAGAVLILSLAALVSGLIIFCIAAWRNWGIL
jgi:diacylglycerol kinase